LSGIGEQQRLPNEISLGDLTPELRPALAHLVRARDYARDVDCDPREFAIEIDRLVSLGLTTSDLRWLVKKGYVEHAREITQPTDTARRFQPCQNLGFTRRSCFFLVDRALSVLEHERTSLDASRMCDGGVTPPVEQVLLPRWDSEDRKLYLGDEVVKEFRVRNPNQEAVLSAFQEEGWPHYIDDPLSPVADQSPKLRLRDTIKSLNANQRNRLIRFRGDGTGERVRWELLNTTARDAPAPHPLGDFGDQRGNSSVAGDRFGDRTPAGDQFAASRDGAPQIVHRSSTDRPFRE
jgi:hypothetical protein